MQTKTLAFLIGCISTRLVIAYVAKQMSLTNRKYLAIVTTSIAIAFMILYLFNLRPTGFESSAPGGKIWWNWLRPVHALLLIGYAWLAYKEIEWSWLMLLVDTLLGFCAWNFKSLMYQN